jgi:IPT/TIG domain/PASTA domain
VGRAERRPKTAVAIALALAIAITAKIVAVAAAATVTVGSPLTAPFADGSGVGPTTRVNSSLGEAGAIVASPVDGRVVSWSVGGGPYTKGGGFRLLVLRPSGSGEFTAAGFSVPASPIEGSAPASLPIHAGDLIGMDIPEGSQIGYSVIAGSRMDWWGPPLADGSTLPPSGGLQNFEMGFNAEVAPRPGISLLTQTSGSVAGGTSIAIVGHDFGAGASVSFGAVPAASATQAENLVLAIAPPSPTPGTVDVSVTSQGGTSPAVEADRFTYTACVVPKLRRRKLKAARKSLKSANCRLGKVSRKKRSRRPRVKRQMPRPGTVLPPGSKVGVRLG